MPNGTGQFMAHNSTNYDHDTYTHVHVHGSNNLRSYMFVLMVNTTKHNYTFLMKVRILTYCLVKF